LIENDFGFMTKKLYEISLTIVEAREYLQQENYENILEMNRQRRFEFNFGGNRSYDDQWTTRVLASVKEEVQSFSLLFLLNTDAYHSRRSKEFSCEEVLIESNGGMYY
jgi:hypothetical protein